MTKELSIKSSVITNTFVLLALCAMYSCSWHIFDKDYGKNKPGILESNIESKWYQGSALAFQSTDIDGSLSTHYFFDPNPKIDLTDSTIDFIPQTPAGSPVRYNIDTLSGQIYAEAKYCSQSDIYNEYSSSLSTPPYTMGFIPRLLDQIGHPQKIIVFGNEDYYQKKRKLNLEKVRVVGGLIENICLFGLCQKEKSWLSHLILVAVDPRDSNFETIFDLVNLKKQVNWPHVRAFLLNGRGHNDIAGQIAPGFRLRGEIRVDQAMLFIKSHGHLFHEVELKELKQGCHKLYDYVWKRMGQNSLAKDFKKEFKFFASKFTKKYQTCTDYVRYSNINEDHERHWFMTYFSAFMKLYQMGYYYNCSNAQWGINPVGKNGKYVYTIEQELKDCAKERLDSGFERSVQFLKNLAKFRKEYVRYITYDDLPFGTHHKIYSFVTVSGKQMQCSEDSNRELANYGYDIFPSDVYWDTLKQSWKYNRIYGKLEKK